MMAMSLDKLPCSYSCIALFSSEEKGRLFVPNAEEKRCAIISSKTGKLADVDVDVVKTAVQQEFAGSLVLV
ncbi:hypothetical protein Taro_026227 [Colocasia esculenta]|uniref:Uncharacterized protein n=1 Tax=Colocasia esculenta TaxID=4460 RepID=A0A843VK05_COLES|nr:hypothetical protein [Colocasia esculenta]